jgi:hypothetical protein
MINWIPAYAGMSAGDMPEFVNDLPAGGRCFVQRFDGYAATFLAGKAVS